MKVSIFTDASVNHELKKGGFAYYIGCRAGAIRHSGKIGYEVSDPSVAEIQCICNALKALRDTKVFRPTKVFVFTDSRVAIEVLSGYAAPKGFRKSECDVLIRECWFLMLEITLKRTGSIRNVDTFFEFKKVKAHTGGRDIYSTINRWCDIEARVKMRE